MRRKCMRQQVLQAQAQLDVTGQAVLYWFPIGFGFIELILHIFPKMTFQF
jgi:hypothetical protein